MKKRLAALFLTLVLVLALGVNAMSADGDAAESAGETAQTTEESEPVEAAAEAADAETEEEAEAEGPSAPEPDAEGTLSFANLAGRMKESYYPLLALKESIDDVESHDYEWRYENLRTNLNDIASRQWSAITDPTVMAYMGTSGYAMLQTQYDQMRKEFDAIKDGDKQKDDEDALWQYRNAQNQAVVAGESLYIALKSLEAQDVALTRSIKQLDRTVQELELRNELGQVSQMNVNQVKDGRAQAASGQKTLEMTIETYLLQLKSMVGAELGEPLTLGALPKVTEEQLAAMDLESDLEKAKAVSYELYDAKKQLDDFKENTYDEVIDAFGTNEKKFEVSQVKHGLQAYRYNYENTVLTYELNFRTLYAQVKDAAQVLEAKKAALVSQEKSYAVSALKYEQGSISANALADAKDELASAKDDVSSAERDLFSKYHTYQWAVEYGILNS